jgi:hypothetical protein
MQERELEWSSNRTQSASIFDIDTPAGPLTVVLASKEEAETMALYRRIEQETGKQVLHVAVAAGNGRTSYPIDAEVHEFPIYYKGRFRDECLQRFWDACKDTASAGQAVLIHCNQSFHRAPLAAAAIMVLAGYDKASAMSAIAERRHIYPGHTVPFGDWPESERAGRHAQDLRECHTWIETLVEGFPVRAQSRLQEVSSAAAASGHAAAPGAQNSSGTASVASPGMQASQTFWRCCSCNTLDQNMRKCWECRRWDCKSCSFWCTTCPKGKHQYTICGHCNAEARYLRREGKIWRCAWCAHGYL